MDSECLVTTRNGTLQGTKAISSYSNKEYYKFCGIPYAKPPIGPLRFQPPQPMSKWPGILNASKERDSCIQYSLFTSRIIGSEDCLHMNIYTCEAPSKVTKPKAVIVQIHPGGRFWGSASIDSNGNPDFFIDQDIVFASINFRLHVLGLLNLNIRECTGNMTLKDQSLALKWIKENIQYFGGDPDNITLYGTSSGAADIHMHMMSPMSKDLFHKAILQDGYVLNALWSYQDNETSVERSIKLAHVLGFKGTNKLGILRFMKRQTPLALLQAWIKLRNAIRENQCPSKMEVCVIHPTIEIFEEGAFLSKSPRELIKTMEHKPLICSVTADEGLFAFCGNPVSLFNTQFDKIVKRHLWMQHMDEETAQIVSKKLRSYYFNDKRVDTTMERQVIDIHTDMWFCEWNDWINDLSRDQAANPVYIYLFDHDGELNIQHKFYSKFLKSNIKTSACHGTDCSYFILFLNDIKKFFNMEISQSERKIVNHVTHMFTNFAKNGNPNGEGLDNVEWPKFNPENPSYLLIKDGLEVVPGRIFEDRLPFWRDLLNFIRERKISKETQ